MARINDKLKDLQPGAVYGLSVLLSSTERAADMMARLADIMAGKSIHFGPFEFDAERRLLSRAGQEVRTGSRSMDVLIALLENPGLLVSTQDLIART